MRDDVERLTRALAAIRDGDVPRPLGKRYRRDDEPSKHDLCTHGLPMHDDCGNCIAEFAADALDRSPEIEAEIERLKEGGGNG